MFQYILKLNSETSLDASWNLALYNHWTHVVLTHLSMDCESRSKGKWRRVRVLSIVESKKIRLKVSSFSLILEIVYLTFYRFRSMQTQLVNYRLTHRDEKLANQECKKLPIQCLKFVRSTLEAKLFP